MVSDSRSPVVGVGVWVTWWPQHPGVRGQAAPALPAGVHHDVAGSEARPRHAVVTGEHQGHLVTHHHYIMTSSDN